jgi:hypothetical protein
MSSRMGTVSPPPFQAMILSDGTPKKAFLTALVVGTFLTGINHGDVILEGFSPPAWKVILTYCVPYCVTTWGAVTGKRAQWRRDVGSNEAAMQGEAR